MGSPTVYFARAGNDGPIKIGYTAGDPLARLASLQTGCPWPINLIGAVPWTMQDEVRFHALFSDLRLEGEWFAPGQRLTDAIDAVLSAVFQWPSAVAPQRTLPEDPSIDDIIHVAGGPSKIAAASNGKISVDAVHKWRRNGIRDWHWALLMSLSGASVEQLYAANLMAMPMPALRVA